MKIGILYGISVGTGDPELITVKGLRHLQQSPVVAFPAGVRNKPGMAETIVSSWLKSEQIKLSLDFPYIQDEQILLEAWERATNRVWSYLAKGQNVAFACEGDVSFYSTFTYLAQTLQKFHPQVVVEIVPGVSSPMAAAASLGMPLTVRNQRLAVLPALYTVSELETVLEWADVVVLLKVKSVYQEVWRVLQRCQLLQSSWVVQQATLPEQLIYQDLSDRPNLELPYFSLLIIKKN